jgi:hypothetical protein
MHSALCSNIDIKEPAQQQHISAACTLQHSNTVCSTAATHLVSPEPVQHLEERGPPRMHCASWSFACISNKTDIAQVLLYNTYIAIVQPQQQQRSSTQP